MRTLNWPDCGNVRDLGGLPTAYQYRAMVDDQAARVGAAIGAIADAPPGCVIVNCHAGMDRTGVVIALTLDLLGVPADLIVADYAASGAPRTTIRRLLTHLRTRYEGTVDYLAQAGVTAGQLGDLRRRMVG